MNVFIFHPCPRRRWAVITRFGRFPAPVTFKLGSKHSYESLGSADVARLSQRPFVDEASKEDVMFIGVVSRRGAKFPTKNKFAQVLRNMDLVVAAAGRGLVIFTPLFRMPRRLGSARETRGEASSLAPSPSPPCPAHQTLGDVDIQDPQPDGAYNPEPMAARPLCMLGAEVSSRKPWTKVYSADRRGWW